MQNACNRQILFRSLMRSRASLIFILLFIISNQLVAQVKLNINISGTKGNAAAYVSAFSEKDKKNQAARKGFVSLELIRYTQYVVVVYQKGRKPYVVSLDTEKANRQINMNVTLKSGKVVQQDYSPVLHYTISGGRYKGIEFDLDKVNDKPAFGTQMQLANEEVKRFYRTGKLPAIVKQKAGFQDDASMRKTEHLIGQEIYKLLGKKRALELDLERLRVEGYKNVNPDASGTAKKDACNHNLNILRREKQYYEVSYKLAFQELEKTKVMINKSIKKGLTNNNKELQKSRDKVNIAKQEYDAADLNYKNKKTDCWEIGLQADMSQTMDATEKQVLEISINDIRLHQRKQNAKRLYAIHNKLAMDVTERDRLVQLAKAQKFVSDHAKARVALTQNKIKRLSIQDKGTGKNSGKITNVRKELRKNEELAFQAEMGYLEHMWNLRSKGDFEGDFVDDLYLRQTRLLDLERLPDRNRPEDFVEGYNASSSFLEQAEALFNSFLKISQLNDNRGTVQEVTFKDDLYEIVMDSKGNKSYFKNNKPITPLTYRFETIKKYGEYLNNIRIEPEKRSKFLDFFKKKTEF